MHACTPRPEAQDLTTRLLAAEEAASRVGVDVNSAYFKAEVGIFTCSLFLPSFWPAAGLRLAASFLLLVAYF